MPRSVSYIRIEVQRGVVDESGECVISKFDVDDSAKIYTDGEELSAVRALVNLLEGTLESGDAAIITVDRF